MKSLHMPRRSAKNWYLVLPLILCALLMAMPVDSRGLAAHRAVDASLVTELDSTPAPDLEAEMLKMVNQERLAAGFKPVKLDPELTAVARAHSKDMLDRGYFAHVTPDGKDPFQRMKEAKLDFRAAGENLALAPTLKIAHAGLMESPTHKANILNPNFGRLGIGIMDGGRRGLMISQEFRD